MRVLKLLLLLWLLLRLIVIDYWYMVIEMCLLLLLSHVLKSLEPHRGCQQRLTLLLRLQCLALGWLTALLRCHLRATAGGGRQQVGRSAAGCRDWCYG